MNPSKSLAVLSLALAVAGPVLAGPPPNAVKEKRHDRIVKVAAGIDAFCEDVDAWKISATDPKNSAYGDAAKAAGKKEDAKAKAADADMGNWKQTDRDAMRANVKQLRGQCKTLRSDKGLIPLLAKDAPLDKVAAGDWDFLIEKLDEVLTLHSGKSSSPAESRTDHYGNYFQNKRWKQADRINMLSTHAVTQLLEILDRGVLDKVVAATNK